MNYRVIAGAHASNHATGLAAIAAACRHVYMTPTTHQRAAESLAAGRSFSYSYGFVDAHIEARGSAA